VPQLIQIHLVLALIATSYASEKLVSALRTDVTRLFILNPPFRTELPPIGNSPQNHFPTHSHGELINELAGKILAFVAPCVTLLTGAISDFTSPAIQELIIRQASFAFYIFYRQVFNVLKSPFPGYPPFVKIDKAFFKLQVVVTVCYINSTYTTIKATRRNKIWVYCHN
jgi:hypothetical protein